MRSSSVFERCVPLALAAFAEVLSPSRANADQEQDKLQCAAAYDQTQSLRRDGKLQAARELGSTCARDVCKDFIRADCQKWVGEIDQSQPSVVFAAQTTTGRPLTAVRVALDGKPWLDSVDATPKLIDPGTHTLRYETDGAPAKTESIEIHAGEKGRTLAITFEMIPAPESPKATPPPALPSPPPPPSPAPWIIGGIGAAALVTGAITGGITASDYALVQSPEHCNQLTKACDAAGASAARGGRVLGPVTTVALVVGAAGVGVGIVLLAVRPHKGADARPSAIVTAGPIVTPASGVWALGGRF